MNPSVMQFDFDHFFDQATFEACEFARQYDLKFGIKLDIPIYNYEWFSKLLQKIGCTEKEALCELGTLGGGNHYIELNYGTDITNLIEFQSKDSSIKETSEFQDSSIKETSDLNTPTPITQNQSFKYLTIHSGSRNFGMYICSYHQNKINDHSKIDWSIYDDKVKHIERHITEVKQLKLAKDSIKESLKKDLHPYYLTDSEAYEYYFDMIFAQQFAKMNRRLMCVNILIHGPDSKPKNILYHRYSCFRRRGSNPARKALLVDRPKCYEWEFRHAEYLIFWFHRNNCLTVLPQAKWIEERPEFCIVLHPTALS